MKFSAQSICCSSRGLRGSVPCTHVGQLTTTRNSSTRGSDALFMPQEFVRLGNRARELFFVHIQKGPVILRASKINSFTIPHAHI